MFSYRKNDILLEWPLYDRPLKPDIKEITPEQFLSFIKANPGAISCDDPIKRLFGAIVYQVEQGIALVRFMSIKTYQIASSEIQEEINSWFDSRT